MKNVAIPVILAATVMVAGLFAFIPVEQASTVHQTGTVTLAADADIDAILVDTDTTLPGEHTTTDTDVTNTDFRLECAISELLALGATGDSGEIFCSAVKSDGGLVDFGVLTVTTAEQLDDGAITAGAATEIGGTDRFSITLTDAGANETEDRYCAIISATDGTSTAESSLCTSRII